VAAEEEACGAQAAAARAMKAECEAALAEAIPALEAALRAVASLNKSDITEVNECVCVCVCWWVGWHASDGH